MKSNPSLRWRLWWIVLGAAVLAAGCQPDRVSAPAVRRPSVRKDPCAERLHDLCGLLLLEHSLNGKLPPSLDKLPEIGGGEAAQLVCPVSRLPYAYAPDGLQIAGRSGLLVVYDATPCHSGMRWGIVADGLAAGKAATMRVVLLPEQSLTPAAKGK
jgi:hypothetical protein